MYYFKHSLPFRFEFTFHPRNQYYFKSARRLIVNINAVVVHFKNIMCCIFMSNTEFVGIKSIDWQTTSSLLVCKIYI